jgi:hypothetical protein
MWARVSKDNILHPERKAFLDGAYQLTAFNAMACFADADNADKICRLDQ